MSRIERESLPLDVLFVGGGPAGLAGALRLRQLVDAHNAAGGGEPRELEIAVIDKAREPGSHGISGAVFDAVYLRELIPDCMEKGAPLERQVGENIYAILSRGKALPIPNLLVPRQNRNIGDYWTISLGRMARWLAGQVEEAGVYVFPDTCGVEILYDREGRVNGVRTGDKGLDRDGRPKANFEPGLDLRARVTVFCEGPRGTLAEDLIKKFELRAECNPQIYSLGVKETIRVPRATSGRGTVVHTMGYPLPGYAFGGGFLYELADNHYTLGLVVSLDHGNPALDVQHEFNLWKAHPFIRRYIDGGEVVSYGAKVIPEGGYFSLPRLYAPGALLCGDSAGFVHVSQLKGIHLAMKSGMLAAEKAFSALAADDVSAEGLKGYQDAIHEHAMTRSLWRDRNFRQAFRHGLPVGLVLSRIYSMLGGGPRRRPRVEEDHKAWRNISHFKPRPEPPRDDLLLDKLTDVDRSRTEHREDQPSHIKILNPDLCVTTCLPRYGQAPCTHFCPAQVYELEEAEGTPFIRVNFSNCVHCMTCVIVDPCPSGQVKGMQNIQWRAPAEGGPRYQLL
ncbi:MAG: electron transfer flavoprotein-ubiquinone oxidoreductase [Acidobacteria bacterium]|nr:MAG: electron transfer flavoprotein-ubiquinone oxidoreductase [Acidobacteriota bacterium]